MQETEHKTFEKPDETREFPNGRAEILKVGGARSDASCSSRAGAGPMT